MRPDRIVRKWEGNARPISDAQATKICCARAKLLAHKTGNGSPIGAAVDWLIMLVRLIRRKLAAPQVPLGSCQCTHEDRHRLVRGWLSARSSQQQLDGWSCCGQMVSAVSKTSELKECSTIQQDREIWNIIQSRVFSRRNSDSRFIKPRSRFNWWRIRRSYRKFSNRIR